MAAVKESTGSSAALLQPQDSSVVALPLLDHSPSHGGLGFLGLGVLAEVHCLRQRLGLPRAPALAPEPLRRQAEDLQVALHVVGQILVQVGQAVGVLRERLVDVAQGVPGPVGAEELEVHHEQGGYVVVPAAAQVPLPEALLPEAEADGLRVPHVLLAPGAEEGAGLGPGAAEGHEAVHVVLQVSVPKLLDICAYYLVCINEQHPLNLPREDNVQKQYFVCPDHALLLSLRPEPRGPLVGHTADCKANALCQCRKYAPEVWTQEIIHKPETQRTPCMLTHREHHDPQQPLVFVARCNAENVYGILASAGVSSRSIVRAFCIHSSGGGRHRLRLRSLRRTI
mmetsp:Transcript_6942/g.19662  ORF Transcript_6942/g.19662 Transcript_6942/m.19662 type:complete len:340 (+) Transcript_6942:98-1117(+)